MNHPFDSLQSKSDGVKLAAAPELTAEQIREIKEQIQRRSGNETVLNEELFGPVQPDTIVIAIQVSGESDVDGLEWARGCVKV